jgi:hypothetical protein
MGEAWGHLLSYFTNADEALHLAISFDGATFVPLNGGRPTLHGQAGTGTLRDPFIGFGSDGDFHLLATDGWSSTSIVHARSSDLVTWSEQTLVPVMAAVPGALNAWAPEFFFDPVEGEFHIVWSSVVDTAGGNAPDWQNESQEQRIWGAVTQDFISFSPSAPFFDPGHSVIDATIRFAGDKFVMAYKDERGRNDPETDHKHILVTTFDRPSGPFAPPAGPVTPATTEGPTLFRRGTHWVMLYDFYLSNHYGAAISEDAVNWEQVMVDMPAGARHASVLSLSELVARRVDWGSLEFDVERAADEGRARSDTGKHVEI